MANLIVGPIPPIAETGASRPPAVHWTEQSARTEDKTQLSHLVNTGPSQAAHTSASAQIASTTSATTVGANTPPQTDLLGRAQLYAALEKLRNTPTELMPGMAAKLMVQCYEYQFNVTAVTHAAKTVEESVQTMTTRT